MPSVPAGKAWCQSVGHVVTLLALQSGAENGQEVGLGSDLKAHLQGPITSSSRSPPPEGLTAFQK